MVTSFDLVRETVGERAGPELVVAVENLPLSRLDELAELIVELPRSGALPQRPVTEVWPLITLRASLFFDSLNRRSPAIGYSSTGVQLTAATDPRLGGTGRFSSGIVRALLYSHGLAIEDPLRHAAAMHLSHKQELRELTRLGLTSAVASLSEIADLLDGDIVNLFFTGGDELTSAGELGNVMHTAMNAEFSPYSVEDAWDEFEMEYVSGLSVPLQALWKQVRGGNRTPKLSHVQQAVEEGDADTADLLIDILRSLKPESVVANAIASVASTVSAIQMLGGSSDILCTSTLMASLLFLGTPDPVQKLRVQEIARIAVPNIEELHSSDLVAIRQSSEALATWRKDLADALDYASRVRREGTDPRSVQLGVEEMLASARERMQSEAMKTRLWSRGSIVNFIAGSLGGSGGAIVGDSGHAIAAGAVGGLLASIIQTGERSHNVQAFLDRHYVAFSSPVP